MLRPDILWNRALEKGRQDDVGLEEFNRLPRDIVVDVELDR